MPTQIPTDSQAIFDLLNLGPTTNGRPTGDALREYSRQLAEMIVVANRYLESNTLAKVMAEMLLREANLKGPGVLRVSPEGTPYLEVEGTTPEIPSLKELREQAKKLGVDPLPFGTKRRVLYDHLAQVKASPKLPPKKKAKKKKAHKKGPPGTLRRILAQEKAQLDNGPMSAGFDETRISPALPKVKFTPEKGKKARKAL